METVGFQWLNVPCQEVNGMKEFAYRGSGKVNGAVLKAFLAAFGPYIKRGEDILCKRLGVQEISGSEDVFYDLRAFLDAMRDFQGQFGLQFMKKIGNQIYSNAAFPPGIDSVSKGMAMINQAYYMNHKDVAEQEIGGYHWSQESDHKGTMVCDCPYPCAFDHGIIETIVRTFAPAATVTHDSDKPCRHKDGESCTYSVEW